MRKIITGLEAMIALANGEKVEGLIGGQYSLIDADSCVVIANFLNPEFAEQMQFRMVPNTIRIGGIDVPAPIKKGLDIGTQYYTPLPTHPSFYGAFTWRDLELNHFHLKQGLIQLTPENAVEHAHALIYASGGMPSEAPEFLAECESGRENQDRKRRRRTKAEIEAERAKDTEPTTESIATQPTHENEAGSIDIRADLSLENMPLSEIAATFHVTDAINATKEAIEPIAAANDEIPTQSDLVLETAVIDFAEPAQTPNDRIQNIIDDIAKANTGSAVIDILSRTRNEPKLTDIQLALIGDAAAKRNAELAGWPKPDPNEIVIEYQPSLAVRIQTCSSIDELRPLADEIEFLNPQIKLEMQKLYDLRRNDLTA